jgi:hypothetical protein
MARQLISFPEHALLIVEERLRDQQAEAVRMPEGVALDELALPKEIPPGCQPAESWVRIGSTLALVTALAIAAWAWLEGYVAAVIGTMGAFLGGVGEPSPRRSADLTRTSGRIGNGWADLSRKGPRPRSARGLPG